MISAVKTEQNEKMPRCLSSLRIVMTWSFKCLVFCQGLISITLLASQWHGPIYVDLCDTHFRVSVSICNLIKSEVLTFVRVEHLNNPTHGQTSAASRGWQKVNQSQSFKSAKKLLYSLEIQSFGRAQNSSVKSWNLKESATPYFYNIMLQMLATWM